MRELHRDDVNVRELNRLTHRRTYTADYLGIDGAEAYGRVIQFRRVAGVLHGRTLQGGRWVRLCTLYEQ